MPSLYFKRHQYSCTLQSISLSVASHSLCFFISQGTICVAQKISEDAGTAESNVLQSSEDLLAVSALSCQCSFFKAMKLPCRHVFSHRITHNMELFDKNICSARWTKNYYHESHRVLSSDSVQNIGIPVIQRTYSRILSQHKNYRKAFGIAQKLASLPQRSQ